MLTLIGINKSFSLQFSPLRKTACLNFGAKDKQKAPSPGRWAKRRSTNASRYHSCCRASPAALRRRPKHPMGERPDGITASIPAQPTGPEGGSACCSKASAQSASLKLKEIAYIHTEAYSSGELKHGPIALITKGTPVIAGGNQSSYKK